MIQRQKLQWFALGASVSAVLSILAMLLLRPGPVLDHSRVGFLVLEEPAKGTTSTQSVQANVAEKVGRIMRECGAVEVVVTGPADGRPSSADLPLIPKNLNAVRCVVLRSDKEKIVLKPETRWASEYRPLK